MAKQFQEDGWFMVDIELVHGAVHGAINRLINGGGITRLSNSQLIKGWATHISSYHTLEAKAVCEPSMNPQ